MKVCEGCGTSFPDAMFEPTEGGEMYEHLGLANVCKNCQLKPKRCTAGCDTVYPGTVYYFTPKKNGKYGVHSWCRTCMNDRVKEAYRNLTPEEAEARREHNREYRKANRDQIKAAIKRRRKFKIGLIKP